LLALMLLAQEPGFGALAERRPVQRN